MSQIDTMTDIDLIDLLAENAGLRSSLAASEALVADLRTVAAAQERESAGLEAENARLRAALVRLRRNLQPEGAYCAACGWKDGNGHEADCWLASALQGGAGER